MYQYLLFDLDGTLSDPSEGITKSIQHALRHFGIEEPDLNVLTPFIGPPLVPSFMGFYQMSEAQAKEAVEVYRERFATVGLFENVLFDGIPEMLGQLKEKGRFLVIASSKPEKYVLRILDHFGITEYFDEIVGADMDPDKRNEKADIIREVFRRVPITGEDLKRTVMIGDRMHDIEGAKICGIDSIGVYTGFAKENELEEAGADHILHSVEEMKEYLLNEC